MVNAEFTVATKAMKAVTKMTVIKDNKSGFKMLVSGMGLLQQA
jgi:hypothetical protein